VSCNGSRAAAWLRWSGARDGPASLAWRQTRTKGSQVERRPVGFERAHRTSGAVRCGQTRQLSLNGLPGIRLPVGLEIFATRISTGVIL
jgi:hypothetical protein